MEKHLTTKDLAKRFQMSPGSITNWRSEGKGPKYIKIGNGRIRYRRDVVEAWEKKNERAST